jgi:hypothetical protein
MSTSGGAGDGAARTAGAGVRLRVAPIQRSDAERLSAVFGGLPSVEAASLDRHEGDAAIYTLRAPSVARLVSELEQVATSTGAALTRTIGGEVVLALPAGNASAFLEGVASGRILDQAAAHPATMAAITPQGMMRPEQAARTGTGVRPRLRAVPQPDAPRTPALRTGRAWASVRRTRLARMTGRWRTPLAVVVLAAMLALALTFSGQCSTEDNGAGAPGQPQQRLVGVSPAYVLPHTAAR